MTLVRDPRRTLLLSLLVSTAVHAVLLFLLPGFAPPPVRHLDDYVEVDLIAAPGGDVAPLPLPAPAPAPAPAPREEAATGEGPATEPAGETVGSPLELPLRPSMEMARAALRALPRSAEEPAPPPPPPPVATPPPLAEGLGRALETFGTARTRIELPAPEPPEHAAPVPRIEPRPPRPRPASRRQSIQGPAAQRAVLYQPPPPDITVTVETEIELKFWIQPDGSVGRVIPLRKGDARLERVAIDYLKQWIFNREDEPGANREVWGIVTIKFRVI